MKIVHKALACVVRTVGGRQQLLIFDHLDGRFADPQDAVQIPKGTPEGSETIQAAAVRELKEESGVTMVRVLGTLPAREMKEWRGRRPPTGEVWWWHPVLMEPAAPIPDRWMQLADGNPSEVGLRFAFRWVDLDAAAGQLSVVFRPIVQALIEAVRIDRGE